MKERNGEICFAFFGMRDRIWLRRNEMSQSHENSNDVYESFGALKRMLRPVPGQGVQPHRTQLTGGTRHYPHEAVLDGRRAALRLRCEQ